ncbi:MAG: glycosyltransferase family 39 protein, partial [Nanoarchaeota archaeon]
MKINIEDKRLYSAIVAGLLIFLFLELFVIAQKKSITVDEISHLASGYSKLKTGDFRLNIEATPLIEMINSLPLLIINPALPLNHQSWLLAKENEFQGQYHWEFGEEFFYNSGNNPDTILFYARIPIMLISVALGLLIFILTKELFGLRAGLFSLLLYILNPTILAHSSIATIDIGTGFFIFLALYIYRKFFNDITIKNILIAGITLGLALLSKFTSIFLIPVYILLAFSYIIKKRTSNSSLTTSLLSKNSIIFLFLIFIIFIIGVITVALGYFVTGFPKYIDGLKYVSYHTDAGHPAYLSGERSKTGWWYYYLFAFIIKEPTSLLLLILFSIIFFGKLRHENLINEYFLLFPIFLLLIISFFTKINIGIRHLIPIYPFIFVFVGRAVNLRVKKQKILAMFLGVLCVWYALSSISIYPDSLAYFNELVGGPKNGPKYLLDSNIDWGQDLKGLKDYLDKNNIEEIRLGYWGKDKPEYRGIKYTQINCYPEKGLAVV